MRDSVTTSKLGLVAVAASAAGYGVSTAVSVAALHHVAPLDLLAVELTGGAVALAAIARARGELRFRDARRHAALGVLLPGLAFLLGDFGLARTTATAGSLLLATEPAITVALAVLLLRERLDVRARWALALGLGGSVLIALGSRGDGHQTIVGNGLVVASVVTAGFFVVQLRRLRDDSGLGAAAWQAIGGALFAAPVVTFGWWHGGSRLRDASPAAWLLCLAVLGCTAAASAAFNWGIRRVEVVHAGQFANLTPVAGLATAAAFLGERPLGEQLGGGALVLAATALIATARAKSPAEDHQRQ